MQILFENSVLINDICRIPAHKERFDIRPYLLYLFISLSAVPVRHYYVKKQKLYLILM